MKIYISLPIIGHDHLATIKRANEAKALVEALGHEAITPFEANRGQKKPYPAYISADIEALLGCDAIYLLTGWSETRGCQLEWRCAQIYKKRVFHYLSDIKKVTDYADK